jgi:hypothetical protein
MILTHSNVCISSMMDSRTGESMQVSMVLVGPDSQTWAYARIMSPEAYGRWLHGFYAVVDRALPVSLQLIRLRTDEQDSVVSIGHPTDDDRWFSPRPSVAECMVSLRGLARALRHINEHRASYGQAPLVPAAAGWSEQDVIAHAGELGWRP